MWFPEKGDDYSRKAALRICRGCPVIEQCREYALRVDPPEGIWGGMTARQRGEVLGLDSRERHSRYAHELAEWHRKPVRHSRGVYAAPA